MFGLQPTHLLIIAVIALIFFGPNRLPELARSLGKSMKEFQGAMKEGAQGAAPGAAPAAVQGAAQTSVQNTATAVAQIAAPIDPEQKQLPSVTETAGTAQETIENKPI